MKPGKISMWRHYIDIQGRMLREPWRVFEEFAPRCGLPQAFGIVLISGLLYSAAAILIGRFPKPFVVGPVLLLNQLGMVLIAATVGYGGIVLLTRRRVPFRQVLPIYALSSGLTLLVAWVPLGIYVTEPWKWWLIGNGLARGCALRGWQAGVIVIGSVALITVAWALMMNLTG